MARAVVDRGAVVMEVASKDLETKASGVVGMGEEVMEVAGLAEAGLVVAAKVEAVPVEAERAVGAKVAVAMVAAAMGAWVVEVRKELNLPRRAGCGRRTRLQHGR